MAIFFPKDLNQKGWGLSTQPPPQVSRIPASFGQPMKGWWLDGGGAQCKTMAWPKIQPNRTNFRLNSKKKSTRCSPFEEARRKFGKLSHKWIGSNFWHLYKNWEWQNGDGAQSRQWFCVCLCEHIQGWAPQRVIGRFPSPSSGMLGKWKSIPQLVQHLTKAVIAIVNPKKWGKWSQKGGNKPARGTELEVGCENSLSWFSNFSAVFETIDVLGCLGCAGWDNAVCRKV